VRATNCKDTRKTPTFKMAIDLFLYVLVRIMGTVKNPSAIKDEEKAKKSIKASGKPKGTMPVKSRIASDAAIAITNIR
jgi:hypothetical protein